MTRVARVVGEVFMRRSSRVVRNRRVVCASLLEFAKTGQLGLLHCGMSRNELKSRLGRPKDWFCCRQPNERETADIWWYGDVEFHFDGDGRPDGDDHVWLIFSDHNNFSKGGSSLQISPWVIRNGLPRVVFEAALNKANIEYKIVTFPYDPNGCHVVTIGGVDFFFTENRDHESEPLLGLNGWQMSLRTGKAGEK